ncbi:MAG: CAP domain-containing protein [Nocardioides sp.]
MTPHLARALAAAFAVLVVLVGSPVPAQASAAGDYANSAFRATNDRRAAHDLRRLNRADCLQDFARRQAKRMANQHRMFHQDLGPVMRTCKLSTAGENVAYGYSSGRATVRAWMNSSGHRANILSRSYRGMGLAARKSGGVWYVAQVFGKHA